MASNSPQDVDDQREHSEHRHPRISKPDMYMMAALWKERSPLAECPNNFGWRSTQPGSQAEQGEGNHDEQQTSTDRGKPFQQETGCKTVQEKVHKAGAVYVLQNDRALSVDCSQNDVHAAVSALNKFGQERAKGCLVYMSRRPCSFCAKLLVQCEVAKVLYLPVEPEWKDPEDVRRVDNIFKASSTGLSMFIPKVSSNVITELQNYPSPFAKSGSNEVAITEFKKQLVEEYWNDGWINFADKELGWPAFANNMKKQTTTDMLNVVEWIARATVGDVPDDTQFAEIDPMTMTAKRDNLPTSSEDDDQVGEDQSLAIPDIPDIPTPSDPNWQKHALHMCRMAQMLSQRSDDPTRRVGCVLLLRNQVVAIGWNGFPAKALYGEFPRASATDRAKEKKDPYVIHAVQNALLTRNKRNMNNSSSILFCNNIPAPECVPMLVQAGVKNVLVPFKPEDNAENKAFFKALKCPKPEMKLVGFWPKEQPNPARRNLSPELSS